MLGNSHFHPLRANIRHFCKRKDEKLKFQYRRMPLHSRPAGEFPEEHHSGAEHTLFFYKSSDFLLVKSSPVLSFVIK